MSSRKGMPGKGEVYLASNQVCRRYGISQVTLWSWQKAGKFPPRALQVNGRNYWRIADIEAFEARQGWRAA